ncbi:transposase [Mameliella alba]|nr:transposase [Mameliella alba]MBY6167879.1 transposase [Mameliella alba]MBY6172900.1 transposase [Mameliella alba]
MCATNSFLKSLGVEIYASGHRRWSDEAKALAVSMTLEAGATVNAVAERFGILPNQLSAWRREASLGWIKRAAQAKRSNLINEAEFAFVLRDAFDWMDAVFIKVATEVELQTEEHLRKGEKPTAYSWVEELSQVRTVFRDHSRKN